MRSNVSLPLAGFALLCLSAVAHAQTDDIYITDYASGNLLRYSFTYVSGSITNVTPDGAPGNLGGPNSAVLISGSIKEGIQGTHNDIIVVGGHAGSSATKLTRYDLNGNEIGQIALTHFLSGSWVTYDMNETGNCIITPDGKYMYAPEQNGGVIDKFDLATGHLVGQVAQSGAHDVVLSADGTTLYGASYSTGGIGVKAYSTAGFVNGGYTGPVTQVIAADDHGLSNPSGMSISGNTLYINQNQHGDSGNGVWEYTISSDLSLTYSHSVTSPDLNFIFGSSVGPDGNLYIAALGDAANTGGSATPVDGIYKYNTTTHTVVSTAFIPGEPGDVSGAGGPAGVGGFYSPKYLEFGADFIPAGDAGYNTPEPSSLAFLLTSGFVTIGAFARRRRRA